MTYESELEERNEQLQQQLTSALQELETARAQIVKLKKSQEKQDKKEEKEKKAKKKPSDYDGDAVFFKIFAGIVAFGFSSLVAFCIIDGVNHHIEMKNASLAIAKWEHRIADSKAKAMEAKIVAAKESLEKPKE